MKTLMIVVFVLFSSISITKAQTFKSLKKSLDKAISNDGAKSLSQDEIAQGLKEALTVGIDKGVLKLSKPDGYFKDPEIKIPMPAETSTVESKLRQLGQGEQVDAAIESMNRAAEDAAVMAKDIFIDAIKAMTLNDARSILQGNDDAATQYLSSNTRADLVYKFRPHIETSLDKVGATQHWSTIFSTYNKIPFVQKVDTDLVGYATDKAIDGLFIQVAREEFDIRKNPGARITDLLKKVFGGG